MKKILLAIFLLVSLVGYSQYPPNGTKNQWKNGLALGGKDSTTFGANDSLILTIDRNGKLLWRGNGASATWKVATDASSGGSGTVTSIATNNGTGINGGTITTSGTLAIDTTNISTRLFRIKGTDSLAGLIALKVSISDTANMLSTYQRYLANYSTTYALSNDVRDSIQTKLALRDTSGMLSGYARTGNIPSSATFITKADSLSGGYTTWDRTKKVIDSLAASTVSGVSSFNGRTGAVSPLVGDYSSFYKGIGDSLFNAGFTRRDRTKQGLDSLGALKLNVSDTATMLSRAWLANRSLDTATALQTRIQTKQPLLTNPITGTGTSGQVAYWNGTSTQTGSSNLFWDNTNTRLGIGTSSPPQDLYILKSSAIAQFKATSATGQAVMSTTNSGETAANDFSTYGASASGTLYGLSRANMSTFTAYGTGLTFLTVGTSSNVPLVFGTFEIERARFVGAGRLLVNTTTDNGVDQVQVNGSISSTYMTSTRALSGVNFLPQISSSALNDTSIVMLGRSGSGAYNLFNFTQKQFVANQSTGSLSLNIYDNGGMKRVQEWERDAIYMYRPLTAFSGASFPATTTFGAGSPTTIDGTDGRIITDKFRLYSVGFPATRYHDFTSAATANRSVTFPDESGTVLFNSRTVAGFPLSSNITLGTLTNGRGLIAGGTYNGSTARTFTFDTTQAYTFTNTGTTYWNGSKVINGALYAGFWGDGYALSAYTSGAGNLGSGIAWGLNGNFSVGGNELSSGTFTPSTTPSATLYNGVTGAASLGIYGSTFFTRTVGSSLGHSGFAVDGSYSGGLSVINLTGMGTYTTGGYASAMAFKLTNNNVTRTHTLFNSDGSSIFYGVVNASAAGVPLTANSTNSNSNKIVFQDNGTARGYIGATSSELLTASTSGGTQVFSILNANGAVQVREVNSSGAAGSIAFSSSVASTSVYTGYWQVNGNFAGSITHPTTTTTNYNTTSDYRIKKNIKDLSSGLNTVMNLKPKTFLYKADSTNTIIAGFLAHEVQEHVPFAVTGKKDAMKIDRITGKEVIDIQQLDQSKIIPYMVKAIQELKKEIDDLKAEIIILKNK